jgi:hypothetical protein
VAALSTAFGQHTFIFLSRVLGATAVIKLQTVLFWRFSFPYRFRLDTGFKIVTPALPTHIEQYSFTNYEIRSASSKPES